MKLTFPPATDTKTASHDDAEVAELSFEPLDVVEVVAELELIEDCEFFRLE